MSLAFTAFTIASSEHEAKLNATNNVFSKGLLSCVMFARLFNEQVYKLTIVDNRVAEIEEYQTQ